MRMIDKHTLFAVSGFLGAELAGYFVFVAGIYLCAATTTYMGLRVPAHTVALVSVGNAMLAVLAGKLFIKEVVPDKYRIILREGKNVSNKFT